MPTFDEPTIFSKEVVMTAPVTVPPNSFGDAEMSSGDPIDADKVQARHKPASRFALPIGGTPVAREEIVFVADRAGTIKDFHAMLNDTGTTTDVNFDLKINGVSILTGVVNFTEADADGLVKDGVLSATTFVADDIISIELLVVASTGAQGPFAWLELSENAL